jgi:hypothetical protein
MLCSCALASVVDTSNSVNGEWSVTKKGLPRDRILFEGRLILENGKFHLTGSDMQQWPWEQEFSIKPVDQTGTYTVKDDTIKFVKNGSISEESNLQLHGIFKLMVSGDMQEIRAKIADLSENTIFFLLEDKISLRYALFYYVSAR